MASTSENLLLVCTVYFAAAAGTKGSGQNTVSTESFILVRGGHFAPVSSAKCLGQNALSPYPYVNVIHWDLPVGNLYVGLSTRCKVDRHITDFILEYYRRGPASYRLKEQQDEKHASQQLFCYNSFVHIAVRFEISSISSEMLTFDLPAHQVGT